MSTATKRPVIGITCGIIHNKIEPWMAPSYGQTQTFVDTVIVAGGTPLLLPLTEDAELLRQLSSLLDGVLFAGGNDINPRLYGQEPLPVTTDYTDIRDMTEYGLLETILAAKKPLLALCRGMQILNVYLGGSLHQDLSNAPIDHAKSNKLESLVDLSHTLTLKEDSKLAGIVGSQSIGANAHHHQAVDALGKGLQPVAWAEDGVIEGLELTDYPYAVCIQGHPESLTAVEPRWADLFKSFVDACR